MANNGSIIFNDRSRDSILEISDGTFVIWSYAFTSVLVISVCGLLPIIYMPRIQRTRYQHDLLQFLIGLAIGTLTADALLHLLPISASHRFEVSEKTHLEKSNVNITEFTQQSANSRNTQSIHDKNESDLRDDHQHHHQNHHHHSSYEGFWFGFMALIGIIGFLILERIMVLLTDVCTRKSHSVASTKTDSDDKVSVPMTDPHLHDHHNHHQHQHHHLNSQTKSFMFMIITGDGLHNFFDGIAIGVSYGSSFTVGLSTSIAILCHELPHEIGDFAVLIKSGMPIKRAVFYNTISSILCLLGATFGVFIGKIDVGWVSALIAGMFLYISLVDMVPQLDCYPAQPAKTRAKKLFIQLCGIGSGVAIMSLIAIYESRLHSMISAYKRH